MGISGLLPALKSIQKIRHLSEFKGQTIAVDAYVWLHKGVYSCATELATGKPTHKYVDYAMHRVRLLRHFRIEPYIVFDGGPLPAKRGTESERKQRREENLSRGKALAAQGKHFQARDCFVKCIDVTPQMAYQFIKALRAENVQYIVAPYEADAQLAYLERVGLVSGILTEDSDLLVFGCKNVLFKLDHVSNTVCHISRSDFGSLRSSTSETPSINLHGWNDTQFRAMAILSGCDYLPSIPGIGLKTANSLLRKWKTAEAVIRAVTLEGKKRVPNGYLEQFMLADKCFQFQRVYDPLEKRLVHLAEIKGEWNENMDAYVGEDIDPELAMGIALGSVDPVTRQPMNDINPNFKPRTLKKFEKTSSSPSQKEKGKEKKDTTGGILSFFGPNPIIPGETSNLSRSSKKPTLTGTASGKRTLGGIMDQDLATRKQSISPHIQHPIHSKFFSTSNQKYASKYMSEEPVAGPSRIPEHNKENVCIVIDDDDADFLSTLSIRPNVSPTQDLDLDFDNPHDRVEQEDGYISPFSPYRPETQDLSSPVVTIFTPLKKQKRKSSTKNHGRSGGYDYRSDDEAIMFDKEGEYDLDVDPISSPISTMKRRRRTFSSPKPAKMTSDGLCLQTPTRSFSAGNVLVAATPLRESPDQSTNPHTDVFGHCSFLFPVGRKKPTFNGPDLQSCLGVEGEAKANSDELAKYTRPKLQHVKLHGAIGADVLLVSHEGGNPTDSRAVLGSSQGSGSTSGMRSGPISPLLPSPQTGPDNVSTHAAVKDNKLAVGANITEEVKENFVIADTLEVTEDIETEMELDDPEEEAMKMQAERLKSVVRGWRVRWALGQLQREGSSSTDSTTDQPAPVITVKKQDHNKKGRPSAPIALTTNKFRRNETNVTPLGKHKLANTGTNRSLAHLHRQPLARSGSLGERDRLDHSGATLSVSENDGIGIKQHQELRKRSSLIFFTDNKPKLVPADKVKAVNRVGRKILKTKSRDDIIQGGPGSADVYSDCEEIKEITPEAWTRLNRFRYQ